MTDAGPADSGAAKARVVGVFDYTAPTYGSVVPLWEMFGGDLIGLAAVRPGEQVLDLACGRGACLVPASEAVGALGSVLGIDLSPAMVEATRNELGEHGFENVEVRLGDAENLDVPDASFDVVTCGFGVFFFPDPQKALAECRRVLRSGGRFAASTFTDRTLDYPWLPDILLHLDLVPGGMPASPLWSADGLARALTEAGFEAVATATTEHRFVFSDVDAYVQWHVSHALGVVLRNLSELDLQRFRRECAARLEDHRAVDGFELVKRVDLTTARKA